MKKAVAMCQVIEETVKRWTTYLNDSRLAKIEYAGVEEQEQKAASHGGVGFVDGKGHKLELK